MEVGGTCSPSDHSGVTGFVCRADAAAHPKVIAGFYDPKKDL